MMQALDDVYGLGLPASTSALELLARHDLGVAPHVARALEAALSGDPTAILEVARMLTPAQRVGFSALPDPLPLVPAVTSAMAGAGGELDSTERGLLLMAAVCVDDRTDVLLAAAPVTMPELITSRLGSHLFFVAGHFSFADPRMRGWVHGSASLAERTAAHHALAQAYSVSGERLLAVWHRSLATLEGDAMLVPQLLELARRAEFAGESEWAHAVAREAASHADATASAEAYVVAASAALGAGFVADALMWLSSALAVDDPVVVARALPVFVHAETLRREEVPDAMLRAHVRRLAAAEGSVSAADFRVIAKNLAKAMILAACLHAARGAVERAIPLLAEAELLVTRHGLKRERLCAGRAWCAVFADPETRPQVRPEGCWCGECSAADTDLSDTRMLVEALTLGMEDDAPAGLRLLCSHRTAGRSEPGYREGSQQVRLRSPLTQAYRGVIAALLHFWSGDVGRAAQELSAAAENSPAGLPLFGLGVVMAARLDVATRGEVGLTSRALEWSHPSSASRSIRTGDLIDRALAAYLDGRLTESVTLGRLADDNADRIEAILRCVPGFDELDQWGAPGLRAEGNPSLPTGHRRGAAARRALYTSGAARFAEDYERAAEISAGLSSSYDRARTEFVLGLSCASHGHPGQVRQHLVVAARLFGEAGADAWQRAVNRALEDFPEDARVSLLTGPITTVTASMEARPAAPAGEPPLTHCYREWGGLLTERELEVAMHVVEGASNRETAARLYVSVRTVEVHLGRVFTKLGVRSRVELSVLAHRMGGQWHQGTT